MVDLECFSVAPIPVGLEGQTFWQLHGLSAGWMSFGRAEALFSKVVGGWLVTYGGHETPAPRQRCPIRFAPKPSC